MPHIPLPVLTVPHSEQKTTVFSEMVDTFGRPITYLRLSVTDRCNLRCTYCMPEHQHFLPQPEILQFEEMLRLVRIVSTLGINKVRITGGEPFVRHGIMQFLRDLVTVEGINEVTITTNGVITEQYLPELFQLGIRSINLSLDTLNPDRFATITRRSNFFEVQKTLFTALKLGFRVKINAVVMEGKNNQDIIPMVDFAREHPVEIRFIEEMPFNGVDNRAALFWNADKIEQVIREIYPSLQAITTERHATASMFRIAGFAGTVGIIAGYSRTFCGECNRIRITAKGLLKTCLYDNGVSDIKALIRSGKSDEFLRDHIRMCSENRWKDGLEAEEYAKTRQSVYDSMSEIGG